MTSRRSSASDSRPEPREGREARWTRPPATGLADELRSHQTTAFPGLDSSIALGSPRSGGQCGSAMPCNHTMPMWMAISDVTTNGKTNTCRMYIRWSVL